MRKAIAIFGGLFCWLMVVDGEGRAQEPTAQPTVASDTREAQILRGEYLVQHVAMCVQCHTPRTARGELDRDRMLHGAPIPVASPFPGRAWAVAAPRLAGLPSGWREEDLIEFLQTGSPRVRPPMPPFRLNQEDAAAVAAYLKSLK